MALSDYTPTFYHTFDALDPDISPDGTSRTDIGTPSVIGGYLDCDGAVGVNFSATADMFSVGTGDFTIIISGRITTEASNNTLLTVDNGTGSANGADIRISSTTADNFEIDRANRSGFDTETLRSAGNAYVLDQDFTVAVKRTSSVVTWWGDVDATGGMSDITHSSDGFAGTNISAGDDVTIGAQEDNTDHLTGRIYFVAMIEEAVSDADLGANIWDETGMNAAWVGGGGYTDEEIIVYSKHQSYKNPLLRM